MSKSYKKMLSLGMVLMLAAALFAGCGSSKEAKPAETAGKAYNGTVKIGASSWIGYAPLYVAVEKGFFKKHGVDVEMQTIQSAGDRKTALAADKIQGMASTVDTQVMTQAAGINIVQVLALDTSSGGDGVVAKKEIASLKDLKGKTVGLDTTGGASYFWFQYLLGKEGMSFSDIKVQSMTAGDAGAAFVAGKIDAAVTWQPWLTNATKTEFGHVLVSSKETPGVIVDSLALRKDFVDKYPDSVEGIVQGWYDAIEYMKTNPDDANKIMAKVMGQSVEEFAKSLPDVEFYDQAGNKEYFGTDGKKGLIYEVSEKAADLWLKEKLIQAKPNLDELINGSFVAK